MDPENLAIAADEGGPGELKDVAMLLECAFQADTAAGGFGLSPALSQACCWQEDFPPGSALQSHGPVALAGGIRDAYVLHAVPTTESRGLLRSALHNATCPDTALLEFGQRLAQLHEGVRVERSTEVPEPENQGWAVRPRFREPLRFAGGQRVDEFGGRVAKL